MGTTYLNRTPSSAGNRRTWTWSSWVKLHSVGSNNTTDNNILLNARQDDGNLEILQFNGSTGTFMYANFTGAVAISAFNTNAVYRDFSGWYHVVLEVDTTQATDSNRIKLYINGVQETSLVATYGGYPIYPPQNTQGWINNTVNHEIGAYNTTARLNATLAHTHLTDGTAYNASAFGQTDATSGIWKPILSPSVTYGTNGFFLKFANSASLGTDSSGNGNNFTVNGSGTQTLDTPSNVFATLNPLINFQNSSSYSNGNNTVTGGGTGSGDSPSSTLAVSSGKYYCEVKIISTDAGGEGVGIIDIDKWNPYANADEWFFRYSYGYGYANANGNKFNNNSGSAYGDSYTNGDIVGIALDLDNNYLYFSKNGVWQNSGDPTSGATGTGAAFNIASGNYVFSFYHYYSHVLSANFGNGYFGTTAVSTPESDSAGIGKFEYSVPSGYYALCTKNIATYG